MAAVRPIGREMRTSASVCTPRAMLAPPESKPARHALTPPSNDASVSNKPSPRHQDKVEQLLGDPTKATAPDRGIQIPGSSEWNARVKRRPIINPTRSPSPTAISAGRRPREPVHQSQVSKNGARSIRRFASTRSASDRLPSKWTASARGTGIDIRDIETRRLGAEGDRQTQIYRAEARVTSFPRHHTNPYSSPNLRPIDHAHIGISWTRSREGVVRCVLEGSGL